jgi:hypothetical protein
MCPTIIKTDNCPFRNIQRKNLIVNKIIKSLYIKWPLYKLIGNITIKLICRQNWSTFRLFKYSLNEWRNIQRWPASWATKYFLISRRFIQKHQLLRLVLEDSCYPIVTELSILLRSGDSNLFFWSAMIFKDMADCLLGNHKVLFVVNIKLHFKLVGY